MSRLVEDVLTAAQMEAERLEIVPARLRLAYFLEGIVAEVRRGSGTGAERAMRNHLQQTEEGLAALRAGRSRHSAGVAAPASLRHKP